jgi:hypothetical protein
MLQAAPRNAIRKPPIAYCSRLTALRLALSIASSTDGIERRSVGQIFDNMARAMKRAKCERFLPENAALIDDACAGPKAWKKPANRGLGGSLLTAIACI